MRFVVIESPYSGDVERNTKYARAALLDSISRGETPVASHLLYPQVLDDSDPKERELGMQLGWNLFNIFDAVAVYTDNGITPGMKAGIEISEKAGITIEYRRFKG